MRLMLKSRIIMMISLLMAAVSSAAAADRLYMEEVGITPGQPGIIEFSLENSQDMFGFQADIDLPEGLEFIKVDGKPDIKMSSRADGCESNIVSNLVSARKARIGVFSANHTPYAGNDGVLFSIAVKASEGFSGGTVTASNVRFVDASDKDIKLPDCEATVNAIILASSIELSAPEWSGKVGESVRLDATVYPDNTTDKTVTWTSSDEAVATVDAEGNVTAVGLGGATITASCGSASATCNVTVVPTPVESVTLSNTTLALTEGETATLTATVAPADATDKTVTWTSSDASVASVSAEGVVTALKAGTATITSTSENGKSASCEVTVAANIIGVESISISKTSLNITEGDTETLTASILPDNATDKSVTWTSSDASVASVSADGVVTAIKVGTATITAASSNGKTASCEVTVLPILAESVTLDRMEWSGKVGESVSLKASVAPANTTDKTVTWTTSNAAIATVDSDGNVTAIAIGEATITATCGTVSATCKVTVEPTPVESVSLSNASLALTEGDTATLTATVAPADATDKTVTWTSSDASVASVSADGVVTALKAGTSTITATSENGKSASCEVTVAANIIVVESISISKSELSLTEGDTETLSATILPENATDKSVTWTTSDASVASVSADGVVTALNSGTATITAASSNGKTASCTVTVAAKVIDVTGVTLDKTELNLTEGDAATLTATVAPANATDKSITWTSSDSAIATVDANGNVTAVKAGTATVTVTTANGKTASCTVKVAAKIIEVTGVTLDKTELNLTEGDNATLTATVAPANATDRNVKWISSDETVATVDADGNVTAVSAGSATIIVTTTNGKSASCTVTVAAKVIEVTGVTLDKTELNLTEDDTATLTATVAPANATDKSITWTSSDASVATVDANGKVTAVKAGTATITVTTANGKTASCTVKVAAKIIEVTGVTLDKTELNLTEGDNATLTATVAPANATDRNVKWISSDETVATVDGNGNVTAVSAGSATVIVTTTNGKSASCTVTVAAKVIEVTGVTLDKTELNLTEDDTATLTATVAPANATDKTVKWSSSDTSVATVDANGKVTAVKAGTATITVTTANGKTASCAVTVKAKIIDVTGVTLNATELNLTEGDAATLTATVAPANATDKSITWTSSDSAIATVDANGNVTAVKAGTATVTVTTANGKTASCTVKVAAKIIEVTGVTLDKTELNLTEGDNATLTATVAPANATDRNVKWISSDETVATVDGNGNVTAVSAGSATVIVTTTNGKSASCTVTVAAKVIEVTGVTLDKTELNLTEDDTATLTATVAPANATDKSVKWSSSDTSVATVDANGKVTAVKAGTATITATSSNGKTASCAVTVKARIIEVTGVTLNATELNLTEGDAATLTATVAPANATDKSITWTSSDSAIATVDANGNVTAVKAGTATVTVTTANGKTASCTVKVAAKIIEVTGVTLDKTELNLTEGDNATLTATVAPANATDRNVKWISSDETVATVDANGNVTAVSAGSATVIVTTTNGKSASCTVTVAAKVIEVTGVTLDKAELNLTEDDTATLTATVAPANATDKSITWTSSDASVATVDANGKVTAVKAGTATITVTTANGKTASCTVKVAAKIIDVTGVTLNATELNLTEGDAATLTATVAPANATDKSITWTSSDSAIATVDANGNVTAIKAGMANVTVTTANGKTASCTVTVVEKVPEVIYVTAISLDKAELSMTEGDNATLTATVTPENATDKSVKWTSSDETVATVDANGKVTAVKAGEATITATSSNGKTASCAVTVKAKVIEVTGVTLDKAELNLTEGDNAILSATVAPANATDKSLTWTSSDASVATVDNNGNVTAVKAGTATITVTTANGKSASCTVKVAAKVIEVASVILNVTELNLTEGDNATLTAIVAPANATDKNLTWTSSDASVVTVDANGNVTAVKAGTATVTVTTANGKSASCTVTVAEKAPEVIAVTAVTLDKTELNLTEGDNATLTVTVTPENATDKSVKWTSSDETVATVDANGKVTAVKAGEATITATSSNGKTASCNVTVLPILVETLTIDPTAWSGEEGSEFTITATVLPDDATDKTLVWSSSDEEVATVDENGNVKVLKEGSCVITVATTDGSELSAECVITSLSGVETIFGADAAVDVYDMNGVLVKKGCAREEIKEQLTPGVYILRSGNATVKIVIR